jgi:hypothetical protein
MAWQADWTGFGLVVCCVVVVSSVLGIYYVHGQAKLDV